MREFPIDFTGPEVRAILENRKSQKRRVLRPQPITPGLLTGDSDFVSWKDGEFALSKLIDGTSSLFNSLPFKIGDRLRVRETWTIVDTNGYSWVDICYKADKRVSRIYLLREVDACKFRRKLEALEASGNGGDNWQSPVRMPLNCSRIRLEVTGHRIERLQDISEKDALREGIEIVGRTKLFPGPLYACKEGADPTKHYTRESETADTARVAFWHIWDSLYGKKNPWKSNPFVEVIGFEVVK